MFEILYNVIVYFFTTNKTFKQTIIVHLFSQKQEIIR